MRILLLLILCIFVQCGFSQSKFFRANFKANQSKSAVSRPDTMDLYIQAGQSIAQGRAAVSAIEAPYLYLKDTSEMRFYQEAGNWEKMIPGVNNRTNAGQHGSEVFLMDTLVKINHPAWFIGSYRVVTLDTAIGTDWHPNSVGEQFDQMVTDYNEGVVNARLQNNTVLRLKGIIWIHGGQDATILAAAQQYETNLKQFIDRCQSEFGSDVPIIIARIVGSNDPTAVHYAYVREAVENVCSERPNCTMLSLDGVPVFDGVHPSWLGHILMGRAILDILTD
jgi:hypothetical protein